MQNGCDFMHHAQVLIAYYCSMDFECVAQMENISQSHENSTATLRPPHGLSPES